MKVRFVDLKGGRTMSSEEKQQQQQQPEEQRQQRPDMVLARADMVTDATPYTRFHQRAETVTATGSSGSGSVNPVLADQPRRFSSGVRRKEAGQDERMRRTLKSGEDETSSSSEEEFFEAAEEESEDLGDLTNRALQSTEAAVSNRRSSLFRSQRNIMIDTVQVRGGGSCRGF